jgi:hypothetical protein
MKRNLMIKIMNIIILIEKEDQDIIIINLLQIQEIKNIVHVQGIHYSIHTVIQKKKIHVIPPPKMIIKIMIIMIEMKDLQKGKDINIEKMNILTKK